MVKKLVQIRKTVYVLLTVEILVIMFIAVILENMIATILASYVLFKNMICEPTLNSSISWVG